MNGKCAIKNGKPVRLLYLAFLLIVIKTIAFIVLTPPWQGPDEIFHFKMAYQFSNPDFDKDKFDENVVESLDIFRYWELIDYSQEYGVVPNCIESKLPGYYMFLGSVFKCFPSLGLIGLMYLGRSLSAFCYLIVVWLTYQMAGIVVCDDREFWFPFAVLLFVGLHPQFSFFSITINSDNLVNLFITIAVFCMVSFGYGPKLQKNKVKKFIFLLIAIGASFIGIYVKRNGLVGVAFVCLLLLVICALNKKYVAVYFAFIGVCIASFYLVTSRLVEKENMFDELSQQNVDEFTINFVGMPGDVLLSFEAYDIEQSGFVSVWVNGKFVANVAVTKNNEWGSQQHITLLDSFVYDTKPNVLRFNNSHNPPNRFTWGIRHIHIGKQIFIMKPYGRIPYENIFKDVSREEQANLKKIYELSYWERKIVSVRKDIIGGLVKLINIKQTSPQLILRFWLVQFISFWFSLGWMVYKMTMGWYALFALVSLASVIGIGKLYTKERHSDEWGSLNRGVVSSLILLTAISLMAMAMAYGPSPSTTLGDALGRCRFMEIGAVTILLPLGLWALAPVSRRDTVMKIFSCGVVMLNVVTLFGYIVPIFYL